MNSRLDRALEEAGKNRLGLTVDRTSSMTAGQVERFWKLASMELLTELVMAMAPSRVNTWADRRAVIQHLEGKLSEIAAKALTETIGK